MSVDINNFSIDVTDYVECFDGIEFSVNVTTTSGVVTTSGTYFTYNGVVVDTLYTTISGGYKVYYTTTTPSGNIVLDLYAENSVGDLAFESYEFYYGYHCEYNKVINYDNSTHVPVAIEATNDVVVPNTEYLSTFFETRQFVNKDLGALITTEGSGKGDLPVAISPQSKYFMYGKTYSITVSGVKDFSGNILEPTTFTFTIENE